MIKTLNVEAEHNELVLKNNHGDYVIIPADKRDWVKTKLAEGCNPCIDSLVESLPIMDDYAEDGTVVPSEPEKETKKEESKRKKKVVVLAETPYKMGTTYQYPFEQYKDAKDISMLPKRLQGIITKYQNVKNRHKDVNFDELRKEINQKQGKHNEDLSYIRNYLKGYYDKEGYHDPYDALNESDENSEIVANSYPEEIREKYKELRDNYTSLKKNISVYSDTKDELTNNEEFSQDYFNSQKDINEQKRELIKDDTFIKESENVKKFFKDKPGYEVEVIPFYDNEYTQDHKEIYNKQKVADRLKTLNEEDDVLIFGHSGDKLGNIDNADLSKIIGESKSKNCYLGSCTFKDKVKKFNNPNKNIYYRPDTQWHGFNAKADKFIDGMYSINKDSDDEKPIVKPSQKGVNYEIIEAKKETVDEPIYQTKGKNKGKLLGRRQATTNN